MFANKMVAVLNKKVESGKVMNALSHMVVSLGAKIGTKDLSLVDYADLEGNIYPDISRMPFIVLKANSNKIKNLVNIAKNNEFVFTAFTNTMTIGSWQEQIERTKSTTEEQLDFWGIAIYGDWDKVTEHTKKFSLWT